jgi:hypothetical protein
MQPTLKLILTLLLGLWLGASAYFTFVTATALFQLPKAEVITRDQAGDIAAALLRRYFISSAVMLTLALIVSGALAFTTGQPRFQKCAVVVLIALLITLFDGFAWAPKVREIRQQRRANPGPAMDKAFGKAHAVSFGLNFLMILGTATAFVIVARQE